MTQKSWTYFRCWRESCNTVLLWNSRNYLWTSKPHLIFHPSNFHFQVNCSFMLKNHFLLQHHGITKHIMSGVDQTCDMLVIFKNTCKASSCMRADGVVLILCCTGSSPLAFLLHRRVQRCFYRSRPVELLSAHRAPDVSWEDYSDMCRQRWPLVSLFRE